MRFFLAAALLAATALSPAAAQRPIDFAAEAPAEGALVLPLGSEADLAARGTMLDPAGRAATRRALRSADFGYERDERLVLRGIGPWSQLVVIGTGTEPLTAAQLQDLGGAAAKETASNDGPVTIAAGNLLGADAATPGQRDPDPRTDEA
ncbi:MAG: hypothetical protein WBR13_14790, partial [Allosphingosinicella sp.]